MHSHVRGVTQASRDRNSGWLWAVDTSTYVTNGGIRFQGGCAFKAPSIAWCHGDYCTSSMPSINVSLPTERGQTPAGVASGSVEHPDMLHQLG
ncbi:hypothetical protein AAFF_G00435020 [Aldrovandia affinis]|uniref:Uncharacterized protein n=1 Tax=Aldrovandia affinis TaxID=143900 RepID=A0AAD7WI95_9TELE|nr:hypothetical protein AAFF_G00435020 [Aldrovandia affinis]